MMLLAIMARSIIHRDLKTANVLLSSHKVNVGVAKVGDCGVAMTMETLKSGSSAEGGTGTLAWMAPETFLRKYSRAEKGDEVSFAILMKEVVSLILPYAGKGTAEITELAQK